MLESRVVFGTQGANIDCKTHIQNNPSQKSVPVSLGRWLDTFPSLPTCAKHPTAMHNKSDIFLQNPLRTAPNLYMFINKQVKPNPHGQASVSVSRPLIHKYSSLAKL
jgi:hypothetical protein